MATTDREHQRGYPRDPHMSRAVHFYRGLGFEIVHGGEEVEFTSFLAGKSFLRRESRKRLVMLGPEAN